MIAVGIVFGIITTIWTTRLLRRSIAFKDGTFSTSPAEWISADDYLSRSGKILLTWDNNSKVFYHRYVKDLCWVGLCSFVAFLAGFGAFVFIPIAFLIAICGTLVYTFGLRRLALTIAGIGTDAGW